MTTSLTLNLQSMHVREEGREGKMGCSYQHTTLGWSSIGLPEASAG